MKQPDELYPDFSHLSESLEKIEKLVKKYDLDVEDNLKEDLPPQKHIGRKKLFVSHSAKKNKLSDLLNPDYEKPKK